VDAAPPAARDALRVDLLASMQESSTAGNISRANARNSTWRVWHQFCAALNLEDFLSSVTDPVPFLQVFARRYRDGRLSLRGQPVRARTVEEAVRAVGRTFVELGASDPRLNTHGALDVRLAAQIAQWKQEDPPPWRVKPAPTAVLHHATQVAIAANTAHSVCMANMIWVGFFFLCRPGEYTAAAEGSRPFRFCDVDLYLGSRRLNLHTAPDSDLLTSTSVGLTFTMQKNCRPGEVVAQTASGSELACSVRSIARQIIHLRSHNAPADLPLCSYFAHGQWYVLTPHQITVALRASATILGPSLGLDPLDISARSLRAAGAMALLCANVDPIRAKMLGRWRSDEMLTYLTMQAAPMIAGLSARMLVGGNYSFIPGQDVPAAFNAVEAAANQERADLHRVLNDAANLGADLEGNPNAPR
jgi:hypothetical protein